MPRHGRYCVSEGRAHPGLGHERSALLTGLLSGSLAHVI